MIKFIAFGKKARAWKEEEGGGYIRGLFWSLSKKRHEDYPRLKIQAWNFKSNALIVFLTRKKV